MFKICTESELHKMKPWKMVPYLCQNTDKYKHVYFEEHNQQETEQTILIFTIRANFLPARPVYIDIDGLRELIISMSGNLSNAEAINLKKDVLELLKTYKQKS